MSYRYSLQHYSRTQKHICPECKKRSFVLYIDNTNNAPIAENVGKCDRASCNYHLTPKEYFTLNPQLKSEYKPFEAQIKPIQPPKVHYLSFDYVKQSKSLKSDLFAFLCSIFDVEAIKQVFDMYQIGATKERDVIYWQLDISNKVRTGKIMSYNINTGKRIKGEYDRINWVHSKLKRENKLPDEWEVSQCLFGEHLLTLHPEKVVCVVESEKTALICSIVMPEYIWLATGGCNNLKEDKMRVLKGRTVILYPDIDAFDKWKATSQNITFCKIAVSEYLNKIATEEDRVNKIDIADVILKNYKAITDA